MYIQAYKVSFVMCLCSIIFLCLSIAVPATAAETLGYAID